MSLTDLMNADPSNIEWKTDKLNCPLCMQEGHGMQQNPAYTCDTYPIADQDPEHWNGEHHSTEPWIAKYGSVLGEIVKHYTGLINRRVLIGPIHRENGDEDGIKVLAFKDPHPALRTTWRKA